MKVQPALPSVSPEVLASLERHSASCPKPSPPVMVTLSCLEPALISGVRNQVVYTGISYIKLPGPKERTMLDENHGSITHQSRQPSNQAQKTISRRRELAFARQRRQLSPRLHSLPTPPGTHLPLGCPPSDDPKDVRYPGTAWSPPIRSSPPPADRNTSRGTATSASWNTSRRAWRTSRRAWRTSRAPVLMGLIWTLRSNQSLVPLGRPQLPEEVAQVIKSV